jgi:hypothetical protein
VYLCLMSTEQFFTIGIVYHSSIIWLVSIFFCFFRRVYFELWIYSCFLQLSLCHTLTISLTLTHTHTHTHTLSLSLSLSFFLPPWPAPTYTQHNLHWVDLLPSERRTYILVIKKQKQTKPSIWQLIRKEANLCAWIAIIEHDNVTFDHMITKTSRTIRTMTYLLVSTENDEHVTIHETTKGRQCVSSHVQ